jgi:NADPH:quinone reductase-like Zn-dependent oxidoreductase
MKALLLEGTGGTECLKLKEIALPSLREGEVLVKVRSISINPIDVKTRTGKGQYGRIKEDPPIILGWDVSGEVMEAAQGVRKFKMGDEVFGMINFPGHGKAYAEFVAAPASQLALKPRNSSHDEAAATTLAALTAWQALVNVAKIKKGDQLLMHAAAGGVGHFAVQIAKHFGAQVTGTGSAESISFLKELGVDKAIDYKSQDFQLLVKDADIVFDPLGGEVTKKSYSVLKSGGRLVSIVGGVKEEDADLIKNKDIKAVNYLVKSSGEDMSTIASLLASGKIKPHISKVFPFKQIAEAHKQLETGRTKGKIVVVVR